jgi:hypothetical protein
MLLAEAGARRSGVLGPALGVDHRSCGGAVTVPPVGFASNRLNGSPATDATRFADFVMMNQYFGTWAGPKHGLGAALDRVHEAFPAKPVIVSEFGFEPTPVRRRRDLLDVSGLPHAHELHHGRG